MVLFPCDSVSVAARNGDGLRDFMRYVSTYDSRDISLQEFYGWTTWKQYFTGEILWDELMLWLTDMTDSAALSLRIISFFIALVWGTYIFPKMSVFWALTFLLHPRAIEVVLSGISNGLAWSVVILVLIFRDILLERKKKYIGLPGFSDAVLFSTPFLHSSSAALLSFYFSSKLSNLKLLECIPRKVKLILLATFPGIAVGLALTIGNRFFLGELLGDRRTGNYISGSGSLKEMSFWLIVLLFQLSCSSHYIKKHLLCINIITWFVIMNFFIPWSYRIYGASIPILAYSIWDLSKAKRHIVLWVWLGYLTLHYLYWTGLIFSLA